MSVRLVDNSGQILGLLDAAKARALERCGLQGEGYAKDLAPVATGNLRNGISHKTDEDSAYIGSNTHYAEYVELGTGKFAQGGGRPTPWVYQDGEGNWHRTEGQEAQPFIKPAVANHKSTYRNIIRDELGEA